MVMHSPSVPAGLPAILPAMQLKFSGRRIDASATGVGEEAAWHDER